MTDVGRTDVLVHPQLLRLEPEGESDELRQVEHRHPQLAPGQPLGARLLEVEVEVAERARRDEAVGLGVDRVAEVPSGLLQRGFLVHRDDREAAALVHAGVVDDRAAERLDHLVQVAVARVLAVDPEPRGRAHDVAAVERSHAQVGQRPLHLRAHRVEPDLLDHQPQEVLVDDALLVAQALARQRLVDVLAVLAVGVEPLLALALRALAGRADVHHHVRVLDLLGERVETLSFPSKVL